MKHVALLLLLAVACKADKAKPTDQPLPPSPCSTALASFDRFVDTGDASSTPEARTNVKKLVLERCVADKWTDQALACMRAASSAQAIFQCWNDLLTKEQRDAVNQALGTLKL